MARRRLPFHLIVPVLLMAIVAVLAALQYRWLGRVSDAERARMHETMTARAQALADDLDHEIARVYVAFQLQRAELDALAPALARRYAMWRETARHPDLVRGIYLARPDGSLDVFDVSTATLETIDWPEPLQPLRGELRAVPMIPGTSSISVRLPRPLSADPLAVSVLLPFDGHTAPASGAITPRLLPGVVIVHLDDATLSGTVLPALSAEHFGDSLADYRLRVVRTADASTVVYRPAGDDEPFDTGRADVAVDALRVRASVAERLLATELRATTAFAAGLEASKDGSAAPLTRRDHVALFIQRPDPPSPGDGPRVTTLTRAMTMTDGAWQVLLKHRAGSLEAAVQQVRRRNLAVSFGMLALLAVSVGLVLLSARRAERLASQQMDFVATVSHELRTPLAVIRSAGQNLAAGVVQDTKRYGELVEAEGRRLGEMIEQTLALAGLSGDRRPLARRRVDTGELARAIAASAETRAQAGGVDIEVAVGEHVPPVDGDETLIGRAIQNLVSNALKYGRAGGWLGVSVDAGRGGREVLVTVADRGPGIASDDLPHIFDAFYRGRAAVADQTQGNGLGLHLVRRIAEAHGGRVTVRSQVGSGAVFTIHLPAAAGEPRVAAAGGATTILRPRGATGQTAD